MIVLRKTVSNSFFVIYSVLQRERHGEKIEERTFEAPKNGKLNSKGGRWMRLASQEYHTYTQTWM